MTRENAVGSSPKRRFGRIALLIMLVGAITLTNQYWIGHATIYSEPFETPRRQLHEYIISNQPPADRSWNSIGANGTNIRVAAPYAVELLHRATGISVLSGYMLLDTISLFLALLAFFMLLRQFGSDHESLLGLLFLGAVLPLTYFNHYFHPWDRIGLLSWLLSLLALRSGRIGVFAVILLFAIPIKYDIVALPGLYFLASVSSNRWPRVALRTAGLFALTFGTLFLLRTLFPGGFDEGSPPMDRIARNLDVFAEVPLYYPPLLAFAVPLVLGALGLSRSDQFARACYVFACLLAAVFFLQSNFWEVRAQMPLLALMAPSALPGLRRVLSWQREPTAAVQRGSLDV